MAQGGAAADWGAAAGGDASGSSFTVRIAGARRAVTIAFLRRVVLIRRDGDGAGRAYGAIEEGYIPPGRIVNVDVGDGYCIKSGLEVGEAAVNSYSGA